MLAAKGSEYSLRKLMISAIQRDQDVMINQSRHKHPHSKDEVQHNKTTAYCGSGVSTLSAITAKESRRRGGGKNLFHPPFAQGQNPKLDLG